MSRTSLTDNEGFEETETVRKKNSRAHVARIGRFRRGFSASVAGRNWRLSARRNFSQTIDVVNGPLCVVRARARARDTGIFQRSRREHSRGLSRERARGRSR